MQKVEKLARKIWYGHNDQGFRRSGGEKFCDMPFAGINGWYTEFPFHQGEWTPVGEYEVYISYPKWDYDGQIMVRKPKQKHSSLGETSDGSSSALCGGSTMELEKAISGNEGQSMADEITEVTKAFDYSTLDETLRILLQTKADAIRVRLQRQAEDIIATGQDLIEIKEKLQHGQFLDWLRAEFNLNLRTAQRFMQVATRFGGIKSDSVSFLPASVLYELASPSTSDEIVEDVLTGLIPANAKSIKKAKEDQQKGKRKKKKHQLIDSSLSLLLPGAGGEQWRQRLLDTCRALTDDAEELLKILSEEDLDETQQRVMLVALLEIVQNHHSLLYIVSLLEGAFKQKLYPLI